jgi:addiction module RelE/StbE family toxin
MKIRYSPRAFADREDIFEYLNRRSPDGARNVMAALERTISLLQDQPHSGLRIATSDLRVMLVSRNRYKIFYRILDDAVELVHIRHTSRRPWNEVR